MNFGIYFSITLPLKTRDPSHGTYPRFRTDANSSKMPRRKDVAMPIFADPTTENLRLAVLQTAPLLRDEHANAVHIGGLLQHQAADLAVTPELSLTGYDLRDTVTALAKSTWPAFQLACPTLLGGIESANGGIAYNVALLADANESRVVHRKMYLPTYGMFDEGRYFGRGDRAQPFEINGWRVGVLICEDFWHPALAYLLAMQGIHVLIVMAAAPGRGAMSGGENGAFFASSDAWERIARTTAQLYGIYVVVCNRVGVERGVTFGGESHAVGPDANVVARAGVETTRLDIALSRSELMRARRPYAHLRDDDTKLVIAELQRVAHAST
jgi:predicted amidohydrolase